MADLTLTITIPDAKVAQAKAAFLTRHPKPPEGDPEDPNPDSLLTDKQWIEKVVSRKINREINLGKREMDAPVPTDQDYFS